VDDSGHARLADFGLASISAEGNSSFSMSSSVGTARESPRWLSPEIIGAESSDAGRPTKQSDVYAFAMVVIQVIAPIVRIQP
jgi:serine/threonine protein kinase